MANFEEQYKELQQIVEKLEKGEVGLDQSLTEFKKGLALLKVLRGQLEKIKNEFTVLDADFLQAEDKS